MRQLCFLVLMGLFNLLHAQTTQKFPVLKGDYLGQTPPADIPVVFARGIISDTLKQHSAPTFSPDGNEVYWWSIKFENEKKTKWSDVHKTMRRVEGRWAAPEISQFDNAPNYSPDGKRLYFGSKNEGENPYFVEKVGNKWSEPKYINLISRFPEVRFVYFPSIANNGTLYFLGYLEGHGQFGNRGIYRAELINGEYTKPQALPPSINFQGQGEKAINLNWTPYIAPDESYLIFCSNRGLPESDRGDLYISFRQPNEGWTDPVSLGVPINSKVLERFPAVSPDGKYLFFTRFDSIYEEDVYWVSTNIIDKLKAKIIK